jgi:cyclophilin family peptidyl-prolyl cis-trans isomerase
LDEDWVSGAEDPTLTFVVYSDFQCPFCAVVAETLNLLKTKFPEAVQVVFRQFPLIGEPDSVIFDKSALAAQAAEAAGLQAQFWTMYDHLYTNQVDWVDLTPEEFKEWLLAAADSLDLDVEQFSADLDGDELASFPRAAWDDSIDLGLTGAPTLLINGEPYGGPMSYTDLEFVANIYALEKRQFHECPPMVIDPLKQYIATIKTEKGDIVIELFPEIAPIAVNSFVFLVQNGWYNGVTFHRVIEDFVAQGGDPSGTGAGGPGYLFAIEIDPDLTFDRPGLFAMANSGPTSNGSQFFITFAPLSQLDGSFTIFGEVIEGLDIALDITLRDPDQPDQPDGDIILEITIEER